MVSPYIAARVLHRDAGLLVIDKPAGLAVHPDRRGGPTVVDWLDDLRFGLPGRPALAHRLDRATSGCLVLGRHPKALARLAELFSSGAVEKSYWALVEGAPEGESGEIDLPLGRASPDPRDWRMRVDPGGLPSLTRWRVLGRIDAPARLTWLALAPVTGRTHQLRVHCAAAGWPILGDPLYGRAARQGGLMLHARRVAVPFHPKRPPVVAEAPVPAGMRALLARTGSRSGQAAVQTDEP